MQTDIVTAHLPPSASSGGVQRLTYSISPPACPPSIRTMVLSAHGRGSVLHHHRPTLPFPSPCFLLDAWFHMLPTPGQRPVLTPPSLGSGRTLHQPTGTWKAHWTNSPVPVAVLVPVFITDLVPVPRAPMPSKTAARFRCLRRSAPSTRRPTSHVRASAGWAVRSTELRTRGGSR